MTMNAAVKLYFSSSRLNSQSEEKPGVGYNYFALEWVVEYGINCVKCAGFRFEELISKNNPG